MKRIIIVIAAVLGLVVCAVIGAGLIMSDDDLSAVLKSVPGAASHTETIVHAKHSAADGVSNFIEDTLYSAKTSWRELVSYNPTRRVPRVVIELEPVRASRMKPPMTAEPAAHEPPPAPAAGPIKLMPKAPVAAEPQSGDDTHNAATMTESTSGATSDSASEKMSKPMPEATPEATSELVQEPTPDPKSAEVAKLPPAPEPVQPDLPKAKPQPAAKKSSPAPPPASPETDNGAADHKKGLEYYKGIRVTKDYGAARKRFESAAKKGHPAAQYNLGIMSYLGQGTEQNYLKASDWFRMAAEQEHALAQYNLGFLYFEGKGVDKDDLLAFMWIDRAATLGDPKAIKARDALAKSLPEEIFKKK